MLTRLGAPGTRVGLIAALVVLIGTVPTTAASAKTCTSFHRTGAWTTIDPPAFPSVQDGTPPRIHIGVSSVQPFAANPQVLLMANTSTIMRSVDGGCTWRPVFSMWSPNASTVIPDYGITWLAASSAGAKGRTYAYAALDAALWDRPLHTHVAISSNGGGTWTVPGSLVGEDLPNCVNSRITVAPSNPRTAYLYCSGDAHLYVTRDAARSWTARSIPEYSVNDINVGFKQLAIDPLDPKQLWMVGVGSCGRDDSSCFTVQHSPDGARHWRMYQLPQATKLGHEQPGIVVFRSDRRAPPEVVMFALGGLEISLDGGNSWHYVKLAGPTGSVGPVEDVAFSPDGGTLLVVASYYLECTGEQHAKLYDLKTRRWTQLRDPKLTPAGKLGRISALGQATSRGWELYGLANGAWYCSDPLAILRYSAPR